MSERADELKAEVERTKRRMFETMRAAGAGTRTMSQAERAGRDYAQAVCELALEEAREKRDRKAAKIPEALRPELFRQFEEWKQARRAEMEETTRQMIVQLHEAKKHPFKTLAKSLRKKKRR
jgi:hypothetical protein